MTGPYWIKQWIADLALLNEQFRDDDGRIDFEALGREEFAFRTALITRKFNKSERAKEIFLKAKELYETNSERGKKGGRPRKNDGDADTREGSDVSTTVSKDMGRVAQNGTHPRIQGGDRAAQGAMSPSPSGAAQDGKFRGSAKNQGESNTGSTVPAVRPESGNSSTALPEARQSQRRAGADSVRGTPLHSAPARPRAKNSRCPNSREEFHAFVADNKLHEGLAEEWYAIHEAREWFDKNGNPIKDWKGALYNYCTKTEQKRRTA